MHPHPLWIIRHGQTEWNLEHRWQGRRDSPLTAQGVAQVQAVGERLKSMGLTQVSMRASPQGRALRSANLIAKVLDRPAPPTDARLQEIDVGDWTGLTRDEIATRLGPWDGLFTPYEAAPNGEGIAGLQSRVTELLADLNGPTILVTHGITSRLLRAVALGLPSERAQDVPGGQGVIHHIHDGLHDTMDAETGSVSRWLTP